MSIKIIDENSGRFEIKKGFSKKDLINLIKNQKVAILRIPTPLNDYEINYLEEIVFSKKPEICFRIYAHYSEKCDLTFLEKIPSLRNVSIDCLMEANGIEIVEKLKNIESLCVGIYSLENFNFLNNINPKIKHLSLLQTKSKKPKINSINRFRELETLYLEGQSNGIEEINKLKMLKKIVLRSISVEHLEFLTGLNQLWSLDIKLGGVKNFDALQNLPNLKYLELWKINQLSDLGFISKIYSLQYLFLQDLRNIEKIPDIQNLTNLRRIYIENLKGLRDFTSLKITPKLEEFILHSGVKKKLSD